MSTIVQQILGKDAGKVRYVDVTLPLAVPGTFTYALPFDGPQVVAGMRVAVPFGRGRKLYGAMVMRVHDQHPGYAKVRPILSALDNSPVVLPEQLALWERMASHYLCTLGEVMIAALPAVSPGTYPLGIT